MTASAPGGAAGSAAGPRFAVVGAYVIDCIARTDRMPDWGETHEGESVHMAPGGKALNMAAALAHMGAHVDAIGVVGDDLAGQTVVDALVRERVGIEGLEVRPGARTPICVCFSRNTDGETAFLWRIDDSVAMDASTIHSVGRAALEAADATIVTFEAPMAVPAAIEIASKAGGLVVLQPAPTNTSVGVDSIPWRGVDVLVPNEREARVLLAGLGDPPGKLETLALELSQRTSVGAVAVTLGAGGVLIHGEGTTDHCDAPPAVTVVDTTGASDAFTARLAYELVGATSLQAAVAQAQLAASRALAAAGGVPHRVQAPATDGQSKSGLAWPT